MATGEVSLELSRSQQSGLDRNLPELHFIAGEGASLVTEHILHLAQVLIQVAVTRLGILTTCGILHITFMHKVMPYTQPMCCLSLHIIPVLSPALTRCASYGLPLRGLAQSMDGTTSECRIHCCTS